MEKALKIAQDFEYKGNDWWAWWIWIEGADEDLDRIDHVIYTLHHTFPNPVRTVRDRPSKFRLSTAGWGVFRIYAKIVDKKGESFNLHHDLILNYPDGTSTKA